MGCSNCGSSVNGEPKGCRSHGSCKTGGCNKLNTFDWLADIPVNGNGFDIVEVSFKNGVTKGFYRNSKKLDVQTGDMVVVDSTYGYDVGKVSLSGELVRLQMKRKKVKENSEKILKLYRKATVKDIETLKKARELDNPSLTKARALARNANLEMKIGDVMFQGDNKKATFFYTANGRVDFRELIKMYASEFKVRIEMKQIGARQEAGKVGGLGSCGRELCCSTWLTNFKSVSTSAARYQNLSINTAKLSGQCGRLKCCLNFELDTYMNAWKGFPKNVDRLETEEGTAYLIKTDIFKGIMQYSYKGSHKTYSLSKEKVADLKQLRKEGKKIPSLSPFVKLPEVVIEKEIDLVGQINIAELDKKERKQKKQRRRKRSNRNNKVKSKTNNNNRKRNTKKRSSNSKKNNNAQKSN